MKELTPEEACKKLGMTAANWYNYLVCRTGPADSNVSIAQAARARGWWNPYGEGFSRGGHDDLEFEIVVPEWAGKEAE